MHFFIGTEMTEAKEKMARADSSSSESEDENATTKRIKVDMTDRPTEEVCFMFFFSFFLQLFYLQL